MSLAIDLAGKRALVTGVTQGIGAGIARQLAAAGADVAGCATCPVDDPLAQAFLASVVAEKRLGFYFAADIADKTGPAQLVTAAAAALGGIDLVVSNAGRNVFRGVEGTTEQDWTECMELDLAAHWRLAQAAKPHLDAAQAPVIILISPTTPTARCRAAFPTTSPRPA